MRGFGEFMNRSKISGTFVSGKNKTSQNGQISSEKLIKLTYTMTYPVTKIVPSSTCLIAFKLYILGEGLLLGGHSVGFYGKTSPHLALAVAEE